MVIQTNNLSPQSSIVKAQGSSPKSTEETSSFKPRSTSADGPVWPNLPKPQDPGSSTAALKQRLSQAKSGVSVHPTKCEVQAFQTTTTAKTKLREDAKNSSGPNVGQKQGKNISSGSSVSVDLNSEKTIDGTSWLRTIDREPNGWIRRDKLDTLALKLGFETSTTAKTTLRQSNQNGDAPNVNKKLGSSIPSGTDIKIDLSSKKTISGDVEEAANSGYVDGVNSNA